MDGKSSENGKTTLVVGLLAGFVAGAGITAASLLIAQRPGRAKDERVIGTLFQSCDKAAQELEARITYSA